MKAKLVTVMWSTTITVNLPDDVGLDELDSIRSSDEVQELATKIVKDASDNLNWKDGTITDVQEVSDFFEIKPYCAKR